MIPERVSFRNEFRSGMKFVSHSHDKIDRLSHLENDRFVLHFENDTLAPLAPDYTVCVFISEWSSFSVYMIPE